VTAKKPADNRKKFEIQRFTLIHWKQLKRLENNEMIERGEVNKINQMKICSQDKKWKINPKDRIGYGEYSE
jgi:hypothetical protein